MKLKKLAAIMLSATMAASMLTACGGGDKAPAGGDTPRDSGAAADEGAEAGGDTADEGADGAADGEQITLRYAVWDLGTEEENNIHRRMIKAYEDAHPNIKIEIATDVDPSDWNASLNTAAAGGNLADVIMIAELPYAVANDWAYDVSSYVASDEDWGNMPTVLGESGKFGSGVYGIPYAMNLQGLYMNVDIFEAKNQPVFEYGYTYEEYVAAMKNLSAPSEGIAALKVADMTDWYPALKDSSYGWYTLKDGKVNLADPLYIEGVKESKSIYENGYSFNSLTDEQKAVFGMDSDWDAFNAGKIAMTPDPTSNAHVFAEIPSKIKFTSLPNGKCVIIPDYIFIGKTTAHPQEAYEFAKFMSFGKEGILTRLDLLEADSTLMWSSLPLNTDEEIVERFFANFPIEGAKEVYENMEGNAIVEAFKFTPGYANARWNAPTGIKAGENENATIGQVIESCVKGELNIDDYAQQLTDLANAELQAVQDTIDATVQ